MENKGAIGKITQVISAVLDIKFPEGHLPEINDAIRIPLKKGGELIVEVAQHLGDDTVRCIALGPTDGLVRGMDAIATGGPISVPVGEKTLGRLFNVLGEPVSLGIYHVLVQLFLIENEIYPGIFIHCFDWIVFYQTVIDSV